jgi:SagB-type dehydrogenase family enzyme
MATDPMRSQRKRATIALPAPLSQGGAPLWEAIRARRSVHRLAAQAGVSLGELAQLAWAAQGVTAAGLDPPRRAAPSAGATYPLETYVAAYSVAGLEPGIYRYDALAHALRLVRSADALKALGPAALDQAVVTSASLVFIFTAVLRRSRGKYGPRAPRYATLEAGHIAQNVALAAGALGLASCPVGAFADEDLNALLGVDAAEESTLYLVAVGRRALHAQL